MEMISGYLNEHPVSGLDMQRIDLNLIGHME